MLSDKQRVIIVRLGFIIYFSCTFIQITNKQAANRDSLAIFLLILGAALILESAFKLSKILRDKG